MRFSTKFVRRFPHGHIPSVRQMSSEWLSTMAEASFGATDSLTPLIAWTVDYTESPEPGELLFPLASMADTVVTAYLDYLVAINAALRIQGLLTLHDFMIGTSGEALAGARSVLEPLRRLDTIIEAVRRANE